MKEKIIYGCSLLTALFLGIIVTIITINVLPVKTSEERKDY